MNHIRFCRLKNFPDRLLAVTQQANPYQSTRLLLDGQQRLTSLSAVIRGELVTVRGRELSPNLGDELGQGAAA
jgi:hypothetical protein